MARAQGKHREFSINWSLATLKQPAALFTKFVIPYQFQPDCRFSFCQLREEESLK